MDYCIVVVQQVTYIQYVGYEFLRLALPSCSANKTEYGNSSSHDSILTAHHNGFKVVLNCSGPRYRRSIYPIRFVGFWKQAEIVDQDWLIAWSC